VLAAVLATGENAYGTVVHEKVMELAERQVSLGSVAITLDRLEDKGYLASKPGPTPKLGGRPKRYYRMRAAGKQALREAMETSERIRETAAILWQIE
jgi:DNA-binding PadR family transcriptional regulator